MNEVTDEDMKRDLAADLVDSGRLAKGLPSQGALEMAFAAHNNSVHWCCWFSSAGREGWPAAIRRAIAAEAFKAWVHAWLDGVGVPHDPEPEHTAQHGCRISGRMRYLLCRATAAEAEVVRLRGIVEGLAARAAGQSELLTRKAEGTP